MARCEAYARPRQSLVLGLDPLPEDHISLALGDEPLKVGIKDREALDM